MLLWRNLLDLFSPWSYRFYLQANMLEEEKTDVCSLVTTSVVLPGSGDSPRISVGMLAQDSLDMHL